MKVLGIETSCDETGIAIYDSEEGLLAQTLYSQVAMHSEYGGVVPELASRDHVRRVIPLIDKVLKQACLSSGDINGIAYTRGPGLAGALLVGAGVAKSLAFAWNIPALAVHHMEGHLLAPMINASMRAAIQYPFVALLVSGGHTQLIEVKSEGEYLLLGESLDDAAGEAFDKAAKMMGLGYPGGPLIAELALKGQTGRFKFPRPMVDRPGLDFSFSGLKTFCLNTVNKHIAEQEKSADEIQTLDPQTMADIALAFQDAVVDTIFIKCRRALEQTGIDTLVLAGGVSANRKLRDKMTRLNTRGVKVFYPDFEYCTDNGAMIAYVGSLRMLSGQQDVDAEIMVRPRWPLQELLQPVRQLPL